MAPPSAFVRMITTCTGETYRWVGGWRKGQEQEWEAEKDEEEKDRERETER